MNLKEVLAKEFVKQKTKQTTAYYSFIEGYDTCQKIYEEKLLWISVDERLPPFNEYVLIFFSELEYCVGCLTDKGFICSIYDPCHDVFQNIALLDKVTHWRMIF